ncbi:hypothetical protein [Nocardioides stalactiti]|uniref:hypothetical protein n=1 Tax=Nocardioides stalactiti TaxID=2755356 RepID=UPI0015FEF2DA|nr:hypothetical protein [Nocardioides stalactiti]
MTLRLAAALVGLGLVAGCSSTGDTADEPADASDPASTSTDASTDTTVDYPEEGVDLVEPPAVEGAYRQALQTYVDFERGRRLAARTGDITDLLALSAVAAVVDPYREAIKAYAGAPYAGDVRIEFLRVEPRDTVLVIDLCVDATDLVVPDDAPTQLGEATRAPQRVEVRNYEGPWRVSKAVPVDGSC